MVAFKEMDMMHVNNILWMLFLAIDYIIVFPSKVRALYKKRHVGYAILTSNFNLATHVRLV